MVRTPGRRAAIHRPISRTRTARRPAQSRSISAIQGPLATSSPRTASLPNCRRRLLSTLQNVPVARNDTVELPGLGQYRVQASELGTTKVITGLPTKELDDTLASLLGWKASLAGLGVTTAGGIAVFVVRRQLRPLRDVAQQPARW